MNFISKTLKNNQHISDSFFSDRIFVTEKTILEEYNYLKEKSDRAGLNEDECERFVELQGMI